MLHTTQAYNEYTMHMNLFSKLTQCKQLRIKSKFTVIVLTDNQYTRYSLEPSQCN